MDEREPKRTRTIDGPSAESDIRPEDVDLTVVLRNVAARFDALLDEAGTRNCPPTASEAADAWSSVLGATSGSAARRAALATTVLRIASDGTLNVMPDEDRSSDQHRDSAAVTSDSSGAVGETGALVLDDSRYGPSSPVEDPSDARDPSDESEARRGPASVPVITLDELADVPAVSTAVYLPKRENDESRLHSARARMKQRRAAVFVEDRARRVPLTSRIDVAAWLGRLLVAAAIVTASAVLSVLIT